MQDLGIAVPSAVQTGATSTYSWIDKTEKTESQIDILSELSNFIFTSKYARYNEELRRRETWDEAVARVETMHLRKFSNLDKTHKEKINWAFDMVRQKLVVPSMRSMQFGGAAVEAHNARIFNCAVRHVDSVAAFSEVFYLLLCGCGVGIGLFNRYLQRMPNLITPEHKATGGVMTYQIPDSIEGWADSIKVLLNSYLSVRNAPPHNIVFDYSLIRKKGSPLKVGGGKAPGSDGLRHTHEKIAELLDRLITEDITHLRTIDAYDILMYTADAVLSGGIRRAATSVMFDKKDKLMMQAKTGNWLVENPQRARSNNSVLLLRNEIDREKFRKTVEHTKQWGEPGFVFADHPDTLFNPCFEISFIPISENGKCGVQFCNLTSINGTKVTSQAQFLKAIEAATIIGTLQASYTDFHYLSKEAKELTESESLLGVSITAMMDNPDILLDATCQREGAMFATKVNKEWAEVLGIKQAARVTCVKPEGTSSLVLETMASGIHPAHAYKMLRRVQTNKIDPVYKFFKEHNPHLCEESVWSSTKSDDIITFPVNVPLQAKIKSDLSAIEHLDIIKSTQANWVLTGTSEVNTKPLSHNVSCTVVCKDEEWSEVIDYLFEHKDMFTAVSLLSHTGDKDYQQTPNEAVSSDKDKIHFDYLKDNYLSVDYTKFIEVDDVTAVAENLACGGGACDIDWSKKT